MSLAFFHPSFLDQKGGEMRDIGTFLLGTIHLSR